MSTLLNYIAIALLVLVIGSANIQAQTTSKDDTTTALQGKSAPRVPLNLTNTTVLPTPLDSLRTGKLIYVKSSSLLVGASVIEEKLQKRREFQQMGLMVTRDPLGADIILEVHHDLFTKYVYTAVDPKTDIVVAGGKLSSLGGTVAGKVAERFLKQMLRARAMQAP
ncbi:MAG TPA: hypothetical protein VGQ39_08350 [Pyrinomonadaceae bacterium]|jgi:hypothetical protein|nr:hypothetical protein [Pyrinomonadaceae bacterium]